MRRERDPDEGPEAMNARTASAKEDVNLERVGRRAAQLRQLAVLGGQLVPQPLLPENDGRFQLRGHTPHHPPKPRV